MFDVATPPPPDLVDWDAVLARIENGEVPAEFCGNRVWGLPDAAGEVEKKARDDSAFAARLKEAKQLGALAMLAECKKIADNPNMRAEQKKIQIDTRKYISSLWNAECNPKTVIEQTTTVRNLTPREEFIDQCINLLGMTREQAAARYAVETGATVQ